MEKPNLKYINNLSKNDNKFKHKIIKIIKLELKQEVDAYYESLQTINFSSTIFIVHKIKHKISLLGLEKSYYLAEEFENNLKLGSTNLQTEFEEILNKMQNFVDSL